MGKEEVGTPRACHDGRHAPELVGQVDDQHIGITLSLAGKAMTLEQGIAYALGGAAPA
jgi:hypothetical protein